MTRLRALSDARADERCAWDDWLYYPRTYNLPIPEAVQRTLDLARQRTQEALAALSPLERAEDADAEARDQLIRALASQKPDRIQKATLRRNEAALELSAMRRLHAGAKEPAPTPFPSGAALLREMEGV
jgi:hypothetical protein